MEQPNLSYIRNLSGGEKEFEQKLLSIIKGEFPKDRETYLINIQSKNYLKAAENAHKLKYKISILGFEKSYELATEFENNLKNKNTDCKEDFDRILQTIADYLNTL